MSIFYSIYLPDEIINIIFEYANIHCKTCKKTIQITDKNNWVYLRKHWYCRRKCFEFI
jgi:hypothetical protein